jgi:P27 family predicted phage terminase small subunit
LSPDAKKLWQSLGKKLAGCGLVTETDGPAFELLITAYLEWHEAAAKVAQTGPVWLEKGDGKIPKFAYSPYWVLSQRAQTRLLSVLREFGMTPSSRSSIHKAEPMHDTQEVNPAARYFG